MKDVTNIPKGYKISSLGIIPEEWEIKILGCAFRVQGGYAFKSGDYKNIGIPIVRISNLPQDSQYVNLEDCVYCDIKQGIPEQFLINRYDLLIAMSGATTGKIAIYVGDGGAYLNQRVGVFKTKSSDIIYQYLPFLLSSDIYENQLKSLLIAGAQPNVAPTDIESLRFPIPSKEEQQRIVSVLQLWDTAIEKQTALIEKLKLRKRGLMQQLLTGKKRLPGFTDEWKNYKLKELCSLDKGEQLNSTILSKSNLYPVINGGINPSGYYDKFNSSENTITISEGGNSCGYVNFIKTKFWSGGHCYTIKHLKNVDLHYLYYSLKHIEPYIMNLRVGSGLPNVQLGPLQKMNLSIPNFEEQKSIASILIQVDEEIELANNKLANLQSQKKGLMQQLLTGKKRII